MAGGGESGGGALHKLQLAMPRSQNAGLEFRCLDSALRRDTPTYANTARNWLLAVAIEVPIALAISWSDLPSATATATLASAGVRPNTEPTT